ncbi:MAG: 4Fe-4S dicluster domain-containing protein [Planctomycetes bacterium]|nr:4Fe-4S dicluster domain-containing protein [Planctomycetota bacterium]
MSATEEDHALSLNNAATAPGLTRRGFLRKGAAAVSGAAALTAALSPLHDLRLKDAPSLEQFFQKHYKEMTPAEKQAALARITREVETRYRLRPNVQDPPPLEGVEFVYALNLSRCIGCRKCVHACVQENNQSRAPEIQYIRVLKMEKGSVEVEGAEHYYAPPQVPEHESYYMPVQCHQCAKPPCVKVCPTEATWQEPDGLVVIDYDWCIGCRYCEAACPYWARRFNFADPAFPEDQQAADNPYHLNPEISYLSNRPRARGVMEKCTFCLHRTRQGRLPACVEVCPTGSRKFGNVLDPDSDVAYILRNKRVFVLKEAVGTLPRFFYYFDERGSRYHEPLPIYEPEDKA